MFFSYPARFVLLPDAAVLAKPLYFGGLVVLPRPKFVGREGFEPPYPLREQIYSLPHLTTLPPPNIFVGRFVGVVGFEPTAFLCNGFTDRRHSAIVTALPYEI